MIEIPVHSSGIPAGVDWGGVIIMTSGLAKPFDHQARLSLESSSAFLLLVWPSHSHSSCRTACTDASYATRHSGDTTP